MGDFVNGMAISLAEWDSKNGGINLGKDYYMSMAYAGLSYKKRDALGKLVLDSNGNTIQIDTDSFKALVPDKSKRDNIKKIISNETTGNPNAKGKKC